MSSDEGARRIPWQLATVTILVGTALGIASCRQPTQGAAPISSSASTASKSQEAAVGSGLLVIGASYELDNGKVSADIDGILLRTFERKKNEIIDLLHHFNDTNTTVIYRQSTPQPVTFYLTTLTQPFTSDIAIGGFITKAPFEMISIDRAAYRWTVPPRTRAFFSGVYHFKRSPGAARTADGRYSLDVRGDEGAYKIIAAELKKSRGLDLVHFKEGSLHQFLNTGEK